jgi:beta-xylosidase
MEASGPWTPLVLVKTSPGAIDPCPLWDDDGRMFIVHAWAKSRAGFNSVLTVTPLSPDGQRIDGGDVQVFDGHAKHPTIEGPKFYRRNGWSYIFAPAGGVATGWQTVLRSKNVLGPYEDRIVMRQGTTAVNGPHQGAWVETKAGDSWFLHFQDRGIYGRVVHLQPMVWKDDWPVIGADPDGDGVGEPVPTFRKPIVGAPAEAPQASDEFSGKALGLQWQWNANPSSAWSSLTARPGWLRLMSTPSPPLARSVFDLAAVLLQKVPAEEFTAMVGHLKTALKKENVAEPETNQLIKKIEDLKGDIVTK